MTCSQFANNSLVVHAVAASLIVCAVAASLIVHAVAASLVVHAVAACLIERAVADVWRADAEDSASSRDCHQQRQPGHPQALAWQA